MINLLKFGEPNAKLKKLAKKLKLKLKTFSLPAGHTCPELRTVYLKQTGQRGIFKMAQIQNGVALRLVVKQSTHPFARWCGITLI